MINISLSFSVVTNIDSWRAKSAISNVVSLCRTNREGSKEEKNADQGPQEGEEVLAGRPDRPYRNFRALKSVDRCF